MGGLGDGVQGSLMEGRTLKKAPGLLAEASRQLSKVLAAHGCCNK